MGGLSDFFGSLWEMIFGEKDSDDKSSSSSSQDSSSKSSESESESEKEIEPDNPAETVVAEGGIADCDLGSVVSSLFASDDKDTTLNEYGKPLIRASDVTPGVNVGYFGRCSNGNAPCKNHMNTPGPWQKTEASSTNSSKVTIDGVDSIHSGSYLVCPAKNGIIKILYDGQHSVESKDVWEEIKTDDASIDEYFNYERVQSEINKLNDKVTIEALKFTKEKFATLFKYCASLTNKYGIYIDPRLMLSILFIEGSGSFDTNNSALASDGGAGKEERWELDCFKGTERIVMGSALTYYKYGPDYKKYINKIEYPAVGDFFDYYNSFTPILDYYSDKEAEEKAILAKGLFNDFNKRPNFGKTDISSGTYAQASFTPFVIRHEFNQLVYNFHKEKYGSETKKYANMSPAKEYDAYLLSTRGKIVAQAGDDESAKQPTELVDESNFLPTIFFGTNGNWDNKDWFLTVGFYDPNTTKFEKDGNHIDFIRTMAGPKNEIICFNPDLVDKYSNLHEKLPDLISEQNLIKGALEDGFPLKNYRDKTLDTYDIYFNRYKAYFKVDDYDAWDTDNKPERPDTQAAPYDGTGEKPED